MREFTIDHPHNEASALIAIHSRRLLDAYGWEVGFWIVRDEAPAADVATEVGDGDPELAALSAQLKEPATASFPTAP